MANFRDARPSRATLFMCLFLVLVPRPVPLARAQVLPPGIGSLGANLGNLLRQPAATTGGATTGFTLPTLPGLPTFEDIQAGLQWMSNPFGLPDLPTSISDVPKYAEESLQTLLKPVIDLTQPPVMDPELRKTLDDAKDADPEAIATLGLLSSIFLLVSSILFTVSGSLGVGAASVSVFSAGLGTVTGPINVLLTADQFQLQLRSDSRANGDLLYNKFNGALTAIADQLAAMNGKDGVVGNIGGARAQLAQARDLLGTALGKFSTKA